MVEQEPSIRFTETPDGAEANSTTRTTVDINTGIEDANDDLNVAITTKLYAGGEELVEKKTNELLQDEDVTRTFEHTFEEPDSLTIRAWVGVQFYDAEDPGRFGGDSVTIYDSTIQNTASVTEDIVIKEQTFTAGSDPNVSGEFEEPEPPSYAETLRNREPTKFQNITIDEDKPRRGPNDPPEEIEFTPHEQPDISVDTSGRFAVHEIIGGVTVRQKIGEDPVEISVNGVCDKETAKQIDKLRNARVALFKSDRIDARVHVASTSTDPLETGGAVDMDTAEELFNYRLNLVSVEQLSE